MPQVGKKKFSHPKFVSFCFAVFESYFTQEGVCVSDMYIAFCS